MFYPTLTNDHFLTTYICFCISIRFLSLCFLPVSREKGDLAVVAGCGMRGGEGGGESDRLQL